MKLKLLESEPKASKVFHDLPKNTAHTHDFETPGLTDEDWAIILKAFENDNKI